MAVAIPTKTRRLLKKRAGITLDISLGGLPQALALTFRRGGDINTSPLRLPFPLPDACVNTAVVTHVLEYLDPALVFAWFDELHRIVQPAGVAYFSGPYGGDEGHGWLADPCHRVRVVEQTFSWLDPRLPFYELHESLGRRQPKPWLTQNIARVPGPHGTFGINATLVKPKKAGAR